MTASRDEIRVLHVDDEPGFAEMTAEFINRENSNLTVTTATCADDGLQALRDSGYDCIISDFDMPGQDGIEFLQTVRETHPDLPFILFTGKGSEEIASDAISKGVTDYLQKKPGSEQYELLANRVSNAVAQYRAEQELRQLRVFNQEIVENAPIGFFRLDEDLRIVYENPHAEEIIGVPAAAGQSAAIGRDIRELPSIIESGVVEEFDNLQKGDRFTMEFEFTSVYGKDAYIQGKGIPLFDDGSFNGAVLIVQDITQQKKREQILEQLRQNISDVVWMTSPDKTSMDFISDSYEDVYGLSPESLREDPMSFVEILHPEDRDRVREAVEQQHQDPDAYDETYRIIRPDGEQRWVHGQSSGVFEDGELTRIVGTVSDITERKRRERELTETNRQLQAVLDTVDTTIFIKDAAGRYQLMNEKGRDLLGLGPEESIVGRTDDEFFPAEVAAQLQADDQRVLERGESIEIEEDIPIAEEVRCFLTRKSPMVDDSGNVLGICAVATDITERKKREHELHERNQQLQGVLDTVQAALWIRDADSRFVVLNQDFRDLFDIPEEEEIVGKRPADVLPSDVAAQFRDNDQAVIDSGEPIELQEDVQTTYGQRTFLTRISPLYDGGELYGTCGVAPDITEQKQRERELERQNYRLEEFTSIVSHDLRNPLNVADGRLELAREDCTSEHLADVSRALERMETLIDDLLSLAREGDPVREFESVDLRSLIETCWQNVDTAEASLVVETDKAIRADRSRLQQLVENLVRNAVEHGGEDVTVTVGDLPDGFYVEDDGPGIPVEKRDQALESGYSTSAQGTGFGLAIVAEIVEGHGWDLIVDAGSEGGARFEITGIERG